MRGYGETLAAIRAMLAAEGEARMALQRVMEIIHERHAHYGWVGVYVLRGDVLELGPYVGAPTEHTRIPVGVGVCGTAVAEGANQVIADVREVANYLSCSPTVRAEIVVLIRQGEEIVGQIDADSDAVGAFDGADEEFLGEVARMIASAIGYLRRPA